MATSSPPTEDAASDDDVPLPDDSHTSPLATTSSTTTTSPLAQTIAGAVLTSLTGTPALGPSLSACTNLGLTAAFSGMFAAACYPTQERKEGKVN